MHYIKYYISSLTLLIAIQLCFLGEYYPTIFFIGFSLFIIIGDLVLNEDTKERKYSYPFLLNLPMYMNLPLLMAMVLMSAFVLGISSPNLLSDFTLRYLEVDLINAQQSINIIDKFSLIVLMGLLIGIMGTVPGHELVHRKKSKFDMFMGNILLAFSWDCAFAIEHVYGHHKNVGLSVDPATARRGENIYGFIARAIIKEHVDAWKIELSQLKRRGKPLLSTNNRMLVGYGKSILITSLVFYTCGLYSLLYYLFFSLIAKSLLEVINYSEHYGLVRVQGQSVLPKHSWNSNSVMSSIYLYNVTRHSSHHEKANLKYWELKSYTNAPMMPQGYLTMLYMALITPLLFHKMMAKKLLEWDKNFASEEELKLALEQNRESGIPLLQQNI